MMTNKRKPLLKACRTATHLTLLTVVTICLVPLSCFGEGLDEVLISEEYQQFEKARPSGQGKSVDETKRYSINPRGEYWKLLTVEKPTRLLEWIGEKFEGWQLISKDATAQNGERLAELRLVHKNVLIPSMSHPTIVQVHVPSPSWFEQIELGLFAPYRESSPLPSEILSQEEITKSWGKARAILKRGNECLVVVDLPRKSRLTLDKNHCEGVDEILPLLDLIYLERLFQKLSS